MAEVDPEQRRAGRRGQLGGAQDRAVAAEHDDDLAAVPGRVGPGRSRRPSSSRCRARARRPRRRAAAPRCRRVSPDAGAGHLAGSGRPVWATSSTRAAAGSVRLVTGPPSHPAPPARPALHLGAMSSASIVAAPAPQPHEVLDVARRPGQRARVTARAPQPASAAAAATPATASARSSGSRTTPPLPTPLLADLELRLDHQHQVAVLAASRGSSGGEHQRERDERQVGDDEIHRAADSSRVELAHVGPVQHPTRSSLRSARPAGRSRRRRRPPRAPRRAAARR